MITRRFRAALATAVALAVGDGANAQCIAPVGIDVGVGVYVSTTGSRALAAGEATGLWTDGKPCMTHTVLGTITLRQESPPVHFIESSSAPGHLTFTLTGPAQIGSCYNSTMVARSFDQRGEAHAGSTCWINLNQTPYVTNPPRNPDEGRESPVILNLGDPAYTLTSAANGVRFDIRADGVPVQIAWTAAGASNAFLALDRNGNGTIDDGSELFGNATRLASGAKAANGFDALAELDANQDSVIDASDPAWQQLLLWTDVDHDGVSASSELQPIARSSVTALETTCRRVGKKDRWGNTFRYMAHARLLYAGGEIRRSYYDVFLRVD